MVQAEFIALLSVKAVGICLITLEEAIEHKLPIRKAIEDYKNKIAHDVYLANTVEELIPEDYQDLKIEINIDSVVNHYKKHPRKLPLRNEPCGCGSEKKFKNCCLKMFN